MIRLGLIGWPLVYSASPRLHACAAQLCGLEVDYPLYPCPPDAFSVRLSELRAAGLRGLNVTAPHKAQAAREIDALDADSPRLGAINTVCFDLDGVVRGLNTDVEGVRFTLEAEPTEGLAVVLGAGGAARAVVAALCARGQPTVVLARRTEQARALVEELGSPEPLSALPLSALPLSALPTCLPRATLLIDTRPPQAEALDAPLLERLPADGLVFTLSYGPAAAAVLAAARAARRRAVDGLPMLAAQGVAAFTRWTGARPPVAGVLAALRAAQGD